MYVVWSPSFLSPSPGYEMTHSFLACSRVGRAPLPDLAPSFFSSARTKGE